MPIKAVDTVRTPDTMDAFDKEGVEGRWLDVPRLQAQNPGALTASSFWDGRAAAAMVYNFYCKADKKESEYVGHDDGEAGKGPNGARSNLRYAGGSQSGKLAGVDDGGKVDVQRVFTAAGMQVDGGNFVKPGESAPATQAERKLSPVIEQLKKNNPVVLYTAMAKGEGGHVVVCSGYKKEKNGTLWLRITDPDAPKKEFLGGAYKPITLPAGPEAMFSEYWMKASQLFANHPKLPGKKLYSYTGNPGRYLFVVREKPVEDSSELVHKISQGAGAGGTADDAAAPPPAGKSDSPAAKSGSGDKPAAADGKKGSAPATDEKKDDKKGAAAESGKPIEEIEDAVIKGDYKDAGATNGAAFKHKDLKKLCEKYCKDDGIDPAAMADAGGKKAGSGDGEVTSSAALPLWYTTWRDKVSTHGKWDKWAQGRSRLGEAFSRAYFRKLCKDKGLTYAASADEHFANLWHSTSSAQGGSRYSGNGKSPDMGGPSGIYCAAAGSLGFERGLNGAGWFLTDHKIGTQACRQNVLTTLKNQPKPLPGDVLSIVSAGTPRTGHVVTVVCPLTDNYDSGDCWVVSGNTGPSGTVGVDLYHFEPRDKSFTPFLFDPPGSHNLVGHWQGGEKTPSPHKVWVYANQSGSDYYPDKLEALDDAGKKKLHVKKGEPKETPGSKPGVIKQEDGGGDDAQSSDKKDDAKKDDGKTGDSKKDDGKSGGDKPDAEKDGGASGGDKPAGDKPADSKPKQKPKNDGPPPPAACPPKSGTPRLPIAVDHDIQITGESITALYHMAERGNGGYFPLGDSGLFHCGAHLMPESDAECFAIADGEVVAARNGTGPGVHPWGDTGFVLTRHTLKGDKTVYSLLVHLKKETLHPDRTEIGWLKRLLIAAMGGDPPKKTKWRVIEKLPTWTDEDKGKFSPTTAKNDKLLEPGVYEEEDQVFLDHKHYVKLSGKWVRGSGGAGDETRIKELSPWSSFDLDTACKNSAVVKALNEGKTAVLDADKDKDGKHKWKVDAGEAVGTCGKYHDAPAVHWSVFSKDAVFPTGSLLDEEWGVADEVKLKDLDISSKDVGTPEQAKSILESLDPDKKVFGVEKDESVVQPTEVKKFYRSPKLSWRARYHAIKAITDFKLDIDKFIALDRYKSHSQEHKDDFKTNAKAFVFWDDLSSADDFPADGKAVFVNPVTAVRLMTSVAVAQDHDDPKELPGGIDRLHADEDVVVSLRDKSGPLAAAKVTIKADNITVKNGTTDAAGELIVQLEDLATHDVEVSVDESLLGKDGILVSLLNETGGPVQLLPGDAPGKQSFNGKDVVPDPKMSLPMRVKKGAKAIPYRSWNATIFKPEDPVSQTGLAEGREVICERVVFRREDAKFEAIETHLDGTLTYLWSIEDGNAHLDAEPPKKGSGDHKDPAIHATWSQRMAHVNEHPVLAGRVENIDDGKELEVSFFAMMAMEGPEHDVALETKKIKVAAGGIAADFEPGQLIHGQNLLNSPRPVFAKVKNGDNTISLRDQAVTIYAAEQPFPDQHPAPPPPDHGDAKQLVVFSAIKAGSESEKLTLFDGKPAATRKLKDIHEPAAHRFISDGGFDELYVGPVTTMPHLPTEAEARMKPADALAHHKAETLKAEPDAPAWVFAAPASAASSDNGIASGLCATHCKTGVSPEGLHTGCNEPTRVRNLGSCHNAHHGACQQAVEPIQIGKKPAVKGCGGEAGACGEVSHDKSHCFVTDPVLGSDSELRERWSVALPLRVKNDKNYSYKGNLRVLLVNPLNGKAVVASQELRGPSSKCESNDEAEHASVKKDEFKDQLRIAAVSYEVAWRLGLARSTGSDPCVLLTFISAATPLGPVSDDVMFKLKKDLSRDDAIGSGAVPSHLPPPGVQTPKQPGGAGPGAGAGPKEPPPPKHVPPKSDVPPPAPPAPLPSEGKTPVALRRRMCEVAKGEVGAVDDRGGEGGKRKGWEHLKDYLEKALHVDAEKQGWMSAIQKPNGRAGGLHWCGIFAVWCAIQVGLDVKWQFGTGPVGLGKFKTDKNYAPGDILVCKGKLNHHCVLTGFKDGKLETVNGNSYYQSVSLAMRDPSEIALYYRLTDQTYEG